MSIHYDLVGKLLCAAVSWALVLSVTSAQELDHEAFDRKVRAVINEVDKTCREKTVYMIGPEKAKRLAELVRQKKPKVVVEYGTAIGYSGLWIAGELKATGRGKLITIEIDEERSKQANEREFPSRRT